MSMIVALVGAEIEENLALRYIASSLEEAGHEVLLFDFHDPDQLDGVAQQIAQSGASLVGLSMIFTARSRQFIELANAARQLGFEGHITSGGHFASLHAEELLRDVQAIDTVIHGDGEEPMVELAENLDHPEAVLGLTYRDPSGAVRNTAMRPKVDDIDARAWPRRPGRFHAYLGMNIANLLSSRGCYASCAFCSIHAFHKRSGVKRFRQRRMESVAREMASLYHKRDVRIFNFQDDNFFVPSQSKNLERFQTLDRELAKLGVRDIAIQAKGRPDCIDEEVIDYLKSMGLFRLFLGVETNAVTGLKTLGRGMDLEDNHRALEILQRLGIHTCFNLLMFDPDSTLDALRENVDFMRNQSYFPLNFCRVEIYGGTPLEERLIGEGKLIGDYRGYSYRITDERAQLAYELFRPVFWSRNFSLDGAHFGSMKLDYYLHLLRRFSPDRVSEELFAESKRLLHWINRNSAELMDAILDHAASDAFDDPSKTDALRERLLQERVAADERFNPRVRELVWRFETPSAAEPDRRSFLRAATATAAAAAVLVTSPSCRHTHMCEAPPPPPPPDDYYNQGDQTHMCEAPPPPEPEPILTGEDAEVVRAAIQARIDRDIWPQSQRGFPEEIHVNLELRIHPRGHIVHCNIYHHRYQSFLQFLCQQLQNPPLEIEGLPDQVYSAGGARVTVPIAWAGPGSEEQPSEPRPLEETHMFEMAPPPADGE